MSGRGECPACTLGPSSRVVDTRVGLQHGGGGRGTRCMRHVAPTSGLQCHCHTQPTDATATQMRCRRDALVDVGRCAGDADGCCCCCCCGVMASPPSPVGIATILPRHCCLSSSSSSSRNKIDIRASTDTPMGSYVGPSLWAGWATVHPKNCQVSHNTVDHSNSWPIYIVFFLAYKIINN